MGDSNSDYDNSLFPPSSSIFADLFDLSNSIEFNTTSSDDLNSCNNTNLCFAAELIENIDNQFMADLGNAIGINNDFEYFVSNTNSLSNVLGASSTEIISNEYQNEKLEILVQPKAVYRPRYATEINKDKTRANRFILTDNETSRHRYPTIKIPSWCQSNQQLYIRVTLVTVISDKIPYHCIHPNAISTPDQNAIEDKSNNSLYFRINENEFNTREKHFCIIVLKKKQDELKSYGRMRLFDLEQYENVDIENPQDPKQKIAIYQLFKSQFVFNIAQRPTNNSNLVQLYHTSVKSRIMTEETNTTSNPPTNHLNETSTNKIICIPQKGNWEGDDEIVIIMSNPIKRKEYTIYFDFGQYGQQYINEITHRDTKTISFRTPSCPILPGDTNQKVSIMIQENRSNISSIDFYYITPMKTTNNIRSGCQGMGANNPIRNKRGWEDDNGENLVSQMNQLSIEQTNNRYCSQTSSSMSTEEKLKKLDKRLERIKLGLEIFVRTNNPSQLFRQTSFLLSIYDGNSSPLHDAIQHGHTKLALALIEQISDVPLSKKLLENENENNETPLLIAAKLNEWELIEAILKKRFDLAKQKDKDENNLLHLLANLSDDKGTETIKNVLTILPNELKMNLCKEKNQKNQTPMDIAQSHTNTTSLELLIDVENHF